MDNAFAKSTDEVLGTLGVNLKTGLTDEQVSRLRAKHGKNGMPCPPSPESRASSMPR
jgi:Ca2+ transporting ATPase